MKLFLMLLSVVAAFLGWFLFVRIPSPDPVPAHIRTDLS
jgi:hypothetical protein